MDSFKDLEDLEFCCSCGVVINLSNKFLDKNECWFCPVCKEKNCR